MSTLTSRPGPRARANAAAHRRDWSTIQQRQGFVCAGCGARLPLQDAHLAGRPGSGACLGPWANAPELRAGLCSDDPRTGRRGCHEKMDGGFAHDLRDRLRWQAACRLLARVGVPLDLDLDGSPLGAIRCLVRFAEAKGTAPDGDG